jgi:membrane-bound ClpP family serine protease
LLLSLGLALGALELFVPSGGVLAFLSVGAMAGAVVMGFMQGPFVGILLLVIVIAGVPIAIAMAIRWWPKTPFGRRVLLEAQRSEDVLPDNPRWRDLKTLVGRVGRAKTPMLPSGAIVVDGRTVDAFSDGMPIEPGQKVTVVEVRGTQVLVRPVEEDAPVPEVKESPLSRPIDEVAADPFVQPFD